MTDAMDVTYELSQELEGHEKAVRSMAILDGGRLIATGGVDHVVCLWKKSKPDGAAEDAQEEWGLDKRLSHHTDFVYAIADSAVSGAAKNHFYTGGKEKLLYKVDYDGNPLLQFPADEAMTGQHEGAVCSIADRGNGEVISGKSSIRACFGLAILHPIW